MFLYVCASCFTSAEGGTIELLMREEEAVAVYGSRVALIPTDTPIIIMIIVMLILWKGLAIPDHRAVQYCT